MGRILLVEDDDAIRSFASAGLRQNNHVVEEATTLAQALERIRSGPFDLWILDRRLPDGDALTGLAQLRTMGDATPALILSAAVLSDQRIAGFEAGADDYVTKPFSLAELQLRVRALLRRRPQLDPGRIEVGDLILIPAEARVTVAGKPCEVTANELKLLIKLCERPGYVLTREDLMSAVGMDDVSATAVDHLVSRMRRKLTELDSNVLIRTVRAIGFTLDAPRTKTSA